MLLDALVVLPILAPFADIALVLQLMGRTTSSSRVEEIVPAFGISDLPNPAHVMRLA